MEDTFEVAPSTHTQNTALFLPVSSVFATLQVQPALYFSLLFFLFPVPFSVVASYYYMCSSSFYFHIFFLHLLPLIFLLLLLLLLLHCFQVWRVLAGLMCF